MAIEKISVPDMGGAENVEVIELCVAIGDVVAVDDSLIVLESDKASMEIPSPVAGTVTAISAVLGDTMAEGDVILSIECEVASDAVGLSTGVALDAVEDSAEDSAEDSSAAVIEQRTSPVEPAAVVPVSAPGEPNSDSPETLADETIDVPELGDAENIEVIEVCIAVGDVVAEGDSLIVLETDKASMEVPSPRDGVIVSIAVKEGDSVQQGMPIVVLRSAVEQSASVDTSPVPAAVSAAVVDNSNDSPPQQQQQILPPAKASPAIASTDITSANITGTNTASTHIAGTESAAKSSTTSVYAGPSVRRLSREMGVSLEAVVGSGPRGRITKNDVKDYVKSALHSKTEPAGGITLPSMPTVDFTKFGEISIAPLSKIGKLTAANMQRNWLNIPHVTQFDEADISELEDFRRSLKDEASRRQLKITPLPFLLKACAAALKEHPKFNASLHADGESVVLKHYIHIGVAVNTPAGLVVPVVNDVDKKSIWELAKEVDELADKAKNRKLTPQQMQGACFTVSSLGSIGGTGFTPIINGPEVAIMGVSKLQTKPVWNGSEFVPRKMLPLSISYDHRVINGVDAGQFFTFLVQVLADIRRLVL